MAHVVFNGTVMRGEPAHGNLAGAAFVAAVRTAPAYRLYSIGDRHPAMVRDDARGAAIAAELYEVPDDAWPGIRDTEPPGLYRGPVELADGRSVEGMLGEPALVAGPEAVEITPYGGWRDYLARAGEALLAGISRADGHPALVGPADADAISYAQLHAAVHGIASRLAGAGVAPGDVVALTLRNGPPFVLAFLGVIAAGAAAAPLNPAYTAAELRGYLEDLRPSAFVVDAHASDAAHTVARELAIPLHRLDDGAELATGAPAREPTPGTGDSFALLLHTSGTTSRPKCVPLRQRNLARTARTVGATYALGEPDVSHCVMPLFHVHGLVASTLATLFSGGTVLVPPRFSAGTFWRDGAAAGATWYSAVPSIHQRLLARARADGAPAHGLRFARSCSSPLPETVWREFEERFGVPLVEAYGMTEAAHQMASNPLPPRERRPHTVGRATGLEIAVLDDDWTALAPGEAGEVAVRGPSVVDGYRDNPEANAASFRDGWFRTGDRGRLSDDGYLTLDGRIKELINRAGEKVSPHEVEAALLAHPAVAEAVAFAAPDAKLGEQVGAAVVLRGEAAERELTTHCAGRLAAFKVPSFVAILDEIPKGPTGKIQRRLMAELIDR